MDRKQLGQDGETLACNYLRKKGYQIVERNYRCRIGEIDIVARHKGTLIFCEVKARNNREFGEPFEAVTMFKQKRLRNIAQGYLQKAGNQKKLRPNDNYRFDVVSIVFGHEPDIVHIENAF